MAASPTGLFHAPHVLREEWIQVKLDSGETVERAPADLVVLPPHLTFPLEDFAPLEPSANS